MQICIFYSSYLRCRSTKTNISIKYQKSWNLMTTHAKSTKKNNSANNPKSSVFDHKIINLETVQVWHAQNALHHHLCKTNWSPQAHVFVWAVGGWGAGGPLAPYHRAHGPPINLLFAQGCLLGNSLLFASGRAYGRAARSFLSLRSAACTEPGQCDFCVTFGPCRSFAILCVWQKQNCTGPTGPCGPYVWPYITP